MKRPVILFSAALILVIVMFMIAVYIPNSLPVGSDFSALYYADLALVNGVHVYDIPKMEALALTTTDIPAEKFFMPRFPYPPWYVLSTFYLGLLSIQSAGTLWFELNLGMLFLSVWFLTDGWNGRLRLVAFLLALVFIPALGALSVGQFGFPVLLGTSMLVYALRRENIVLTVIGVVLLTFKPHLGALIFLSVLVWLIASRSSFGRSVMRSIIAAGILLCLLGLIADPLWFINYPKMLLNYQGEVNVTTCSECASVPVWASRQFFDGSLAKATLTAAVLLILFAFLLVLIRKSLSKSPALTVTAVLLVTLLVSPYLYNYDFILLLIPFAVLGNSKGIAGWVVVILCYLVPSVAILLLGREGNMLLLVSAMVVAVFMSVRARDMNLFASN
jgi:hypothetical protein